jgi:hypothetical protein
LTVLGKIIKLFALKILVGINVVFYLDKYTGTSKEVGESETCCPYSQKYMEKKIKLEIKIDHILTPKIKIVFKLGFI